VTGWYYGYNKEVQLAYRVPNAPWFGDKLKDAELCSRIEYDKNDNAVLGGLVIAHWPDGQTWTVAGVSRDNYLAAKSQKSKKAADKLWQSQVADTKHELYIKQRVDRGPAPLLLSVFEQGNQIASIDLKLFGEIPEKPNRFEPDHPVLVKALALLVPFVEQYATGENLTAPELKQQLKDDLKLRGFVKPRKGQTAVAKEGEASDGPPHDHAPSAAASLKGPAVPKADGVASVDQPLDHAPSAATFVKGPVAKAPEGAKFVAKRPAAASLAPVLRAAHAQVPAAANAQAVHPSVHLEVRTMPLFMEEEIENNLWLHLGEHEPACRVGFSVGYQNPNK
jgi:hypothetical protein